MVSDSQKPILASRIRKAGFDDAGPVIQAWLEQSTATVEAAEGQSLGNRIIRRILSMRSYFLNHKWRVAFTTGFLALGVAACTYPVEYTDTLGHIITVHCSGEYSAVYHAIQDEFHIQADEIKIWTEMRDNQEITQLSAYVMSLEDEEVSRIIANLQQEDGVTNVNYSSVTESGKQPVLARALDLFFHIQLNLSAGSEEEMAQQIREQLLQQGASPSQIEVITGPDGTYEFGFEFDGFGDGSEEIQMTMFIEDSGVDQEVGIQIGADEEMMQILRQQGIHDENDLNNTEGEIQVKTLHYDGGEIQIKSEEELKALLDGGLLELQEGLPENIEVQKENGELQVKLGEKPQ